jgi:hypothetical protein
LDKHLAMNEYCNKLKELAMLMIIRAKEFMRKMKLICLNLLLILMSKIINNINKINKKELIIRIIKLKNQLEILNKVLKISI